MILRASGARALGVTLVKCDIKMRSELTSQSGERLRRFLREICR